MRRDRDLRFRMILRQDKDLLPAGPLGVRAVCIKVDAKREALKMTNDRTDDIRKKLAQSRRILQQVTDPDSVESVRKYIEGLEGQMLRVMSEGLPKRKRRPKV
jgi:hypothetical protein